MTRPDLYRELAHERPNQAAVGGALITVVEPLAGHERAYNRWYEDDHFYAGAMAGPWTFAGRRYVATQALRRDWRPTDPGAAALPQPGCYLSLYWITEGHRGDNQLWAMTAMYDELAPAGRAFQDRRHIYTAFHDLAFGFVFDPPPMRIEHALDHPYAGVVLELIDLAPGRDATGLERWLRDDLARSAPDCGQCLGFTPTRPQPEFSGQAPSSGGPDRLCLVWFVRDDPRTQLPDHVLAHEQSLDRTLGTVAMIAPFIPTVPGTHRYVDELG